MAARRFILTLMVVIGLIANLVPMPTLARPMLAPDGTNLIVPENNRTGNPSSEWDISGAGDSTIQGYATDISVNRGGTIAFKVDTVASSFQIKIYRLGYYNGLGARLIDTIPNTATTATTQPACTNSGAPDYLVDCGGWSVSASWTAIDPTYDPDINAVSGLYIARLERTDGTSGASHIPFIVRDDSGNSDLLFQTSDTTWQAYNGYGNYSLYANSNHAHKVSYNRPFTTRANPIEDNLFNAEYPMIRWLERNGYDVSYFTDVDSDRYGSEILEHKVFLSVGHDEYWSAGQRTAVETARDAGVHLAFFSGNEIYWKTRWENNYRTLVSYKEGDAQGSEHYDCQGNFSCDPDPTVWTGLWRQNAAGHDGGRPENSLSGQISWGDATSAIQVPASAGSLRFWRNAGIATDTTLAASTLGYEFDWEQAAYASSYPAGRITLSDTTVGGKIHKMSLYRATSGALVFGAGTVQWSWGLDGTHDRGGSTPDSRMQQATVNLFADMGVQPASLQSGLTAATASTDSTAPTVTITSPANGATVPGGNITVTGTASDTGGVVAAVKVSTDGGTTWNTATGTSNWTYTFNAVNSSVTVQVRAIDDSVNLGTVTSITFNVGLRTCPCSIWEGSGTPTTLNDSDGQPIEVGVKFRTTVDGYITGLRFYKGNLSTGTHVGHLWTSTGTQLAEATFTGESASGWQEVTLGAPVAVTANTTYIASYHSSNNYYASSVNYFTTATDNPPVRALANGEDGPNGLYKLGASGFPNLDFNASNYWVDVIFVTSVGPDTTPPVVNSVTPANTAGNVSTSANISAVFNEPLDATTVSGATFELRDSTTALVPATVTYNNATRTATLDPTAALAYSTAYTAKLISGTSGIKDVAGNELASDYTWSFTTASAPLPPPDEGPGGPILVISAAANPFSRYYAEILRAEGLNAFFATDISLMTSTLLNAYDVVILGEMPLTGDQVTSLSDWVNAGGNLIAMRPDPQLASLLGLTPASPTLSEAYLLVNTAAAPGQGIVGETIQFHGTADRYTLNGATSIATLYSNAATATSNPAVTIRSVGSNGGQAAAFTYDLAKSIVYTRQGNPAWAGINGDGSSGPVRADDMFHNGADPDWVNLNKVAIPQADEQQRLLANMIGFMNLDKKPLPRFWYFPRGEKAVVVMTHDEHGGGDLVTRLNRYNTLSPTGCNLNDWECVRSTTYIYTNAQITDAQLAAFQTQGHEFAVHVDTNCANFTLSSLGNFYATQIPALKAQFPSINAPLTQRTHCIAFSDWSSQPKVQLQSGMRLDTNYYYWPSSWILDRPGMFTGSGMPMRFANTDGTMIDVYQATTQMTDESGQTLATHINALLNNAVGASGYYGVFTANMHTDGGTNASNGAESIIASAQANSVPVVSAQQMLAWLDGRNASSFANITMSGNTLSFSVNANSGANGLEALVPAQNGTLSLQSLTRGGTPVSFTVETIKGVSYTRFAASTGAYVAQYASDTTAPVISAVLATPNPDGTVTITWTTDEPSDSRVDYGTVSGALNLNSSNASLVTSHSVTLTGLTAGTTYYFTVTSKDAADNSATSTEAGFTPLVDDPCPCSIWNNTPTVGGNPGDGSGYELGFKFRSSQDGSITALRFYKYPGNTGTHVGHLWSITGALLGSATFTSETASGWQEVTFMPAIPITANTVYVASYSTTTGNYAFSGNYFTSQGVDNGPLRALSASESPAPGRNGVLNSTPGNFPNLTFSDANYWVDVVFDTAPLSDTTPPTVSAVTPISNATDVALNTTVTATFSEAIAPLTLNSSNFELRDAANAVVSATISYNAATWVATLTPNAALAPNTVYTAKLKSGPGGVSDVAGNPLAADYSWSFTTAADNCPCSIWDFTGTPQRSGVHDGQPIEVGTKFRSDSNGYITAIRYYKGVGDTDTHVGHLWASTGGSPLATVTFTGGTASGWQEMALPTPIAITANTTYIVSIFSSPTGYFAITDAGLNTAVINPPLKALAAGEDGPNGVFKYGGGFPDGGGNANYWVDAVFQTTLPGDTTPPVISGISATPGTGGTTATITWTTNEPATSRVDYGTTPDALTPSATNGALVTSHSLPLTGLTAGTTYYYRVTSVDAATNSATSPTAPADPLTFVTPAPDTTPPVISSVSAVPGANGSATITWNTDELSTSRVDYGIDSGDLNLNVSAPALVTAHSLVLSGLLPNTTYHYRVTSVDASTNSASSPASPATATFTTPAASFADTTTANFSAGTLNSCVADGTIGDGAVRLPAAIDEPFSGITLPAGWTNTPWTGGTATIGGGSLAVDGTRYRNDTLYGPGRSIEFVATFGLQNFQHIGFAESFETPNESWVAFSTHNTGAGLYARTNNNNNEVNTLIPGAWLGAPHRYRIDWGLSSVAFYIDGDLVHTQDVAITTNMRATTSDYQIGGATLTVDWLRVMPYASPCSFESRVFDAGAPANWGTLAWTGSTPTGTSLALGYRIGNTAIPDGSWTAFVPVASSGAALAGNSRYIQYSATLTASDPSQTPVLNDVLIIYALGSETTPPTITDRSPAPNVSGVNVTSNVVVTFSELMDAATITNSSVRLRRVGAGSDVTATVTLAGIVATLDPSADLLPMTTYQVTVAASVADLVGNPLGADDTWTFTTGAVILSATDTTVANFSAGTLNACVIDATIGDGALRLSGTFEQNFSGTTLPADWTWGVWNTGGTASVSGGALTVDGARSYSNLSFGPGRSLEFRATFTAENFQNIGFASDGDFNSPWIVIGRGGNNPNPSGVYARMEYGEPVLLSTTTLNTPHVYRIDWTASGFVFYVDDVVVGAATNSRSVTSNMVVIVSDFNTGGGALTVDWVRVSPPYASPCTFESRVIDAGSTVDWLDLSHLGASPTGTSVGFETRTGDTVDA